MRRLARTLLCLGLALGAAFVWAPASFGQATTGAISGLVADQDSGALPGVTITAVHVPTGTRYTTITRADGRYNILGVRVGGPYTVDAELAGFKPDQKTNQFVSLGEDLQVNFTLQLETVTETVNVVAEASSIINPSRTGAISNVGSEELQKLPTVARSLQDFARLNPYFSTVPNGTQDAVSVAGRNNRYNNIQIDGAVNNDLFGLAATGTPGGQAETQPVSLDAIQELQLLVSPYDVRQGGFSGGGINAVTRSGSNKFKGTAYYYTRDQDYVGDGPNNRPFGPFDEDQYGISLGGPILRDKLFFFVNGDSVNKNTPVGFSIGGGSGQDFGHQAEAARFTSILSRYGYNPGGLGEFVRATESDKVFLRFDYNAGSNQFTLRHNYVDALNDVGSQSISRYQFPDRFYQFLDTTNSTVFQANSVFGSDTFNEFRVSYQTIKDDRSGATRFPAVTVTLSDGSSLVAGTENFSTANSLDQEILEIHDDLTLIRGDHTITLGTHNELFNFDNLFIRDNFGTYSFASLDDFDRGWANSFDYSFSATDDPKLSAKFDVQQLGFYAGDEWRVNDNFTLNLGLRVDIPLFPDAPTRNPESEQAFGFRTDVTADESPVLSPRLGFNWDLSGEGKQQLRGGIGIFSGRTPYVWLSNQYSNTGIEFTRLSRFIPPATVGPNNFIAFVPDPDGQPTSVGSAATNEIDLVDPNFELPQVLRVSLGYDRELGFWDLIGTAEVMYNDVQKDIVYENLNVVPTGNNLFDGRPTFQRLDPRFRDVILLRNTNEGDQWNASVKIERPFRDGFYGSVSYIWGESRSVNDGTSSQARSNWRFLPISGNPNDPGVSTSNFEVEHRFNAALSYQFKIFRELSSTVSLFYNAQSGTPYSTTYSRDINGDFEDNDLIYVPAGPDDVIVEGGTWADLNAYIKADEGLDKARGGIVGRNASRTPWTHTLDFRYALNIPVRSRELQVTFDILNLANLLDSSAGVVKFASFNEISPIEFRGVDAATGKPIYRLLFNSDRRFTIDDLRSRWQAQLGVRFSF